MLQSKPRKHFRLDAKRFNAETSIILIAVIKIMNIDYNMN